MLHMYSKVPTGRRQSMMQGPGCKNALSRARFTFPDRWSRLRQHELNCCLDREVIAPQNRDGGEGSMLAPRVPALFEGSLALALQCLAAHCRSEHAPLTPAPDFLAGEILHHEIVGLSVGKAQLEHLRRIVAHAESEMELVRVIPGSRDVERGNDRRRFLFSAMARGSDWFFVVGKRSRGERDRCCAQQR